MDLGLIGLLAQSADFNGELRVIGTLPPNFAVDAEGTMVGQDFVLDSRFRTGMTITKEDWTLAAEGDFFTGQLLGDAWDLEGDIHRRHLEEVSLWSENSFVPREASITGKIWKFNVLAGLTQAQWGLGMVANDGATQPIFGRNDYGDRVMRLQLFSAVNPTLFLSIAGDVIIEDDMASFAEGQRAWQNSNALIFIPTDDFEFGFALILRNQSEADSTETTGALADLYGKHRMDLRGYTLSLNYEAALLQGDTSRFSNYNYRIRHGLAAQGVTGEFSIDAPEERWGLFTRAGFTTGDGNPDDGTIRDFSFDRDYNAGMLLYDYYQSALEVGMYNQLTDTSNAGSPPDGVDAVVTEGAIRRGAFVQPVLYAHPAPWLQVKTGAVFAWSSAPISQGFYTYRNGGVPVNHLGEATEENYLGTEINWGVALDSSMLLGTTYDSKLEIQGAHLLTSEDYGGGEVLSMIAIQGNIAF